ncbi:hypothetical protein COHA_008537 [Chlorella ohadii]|uniref:Uncharacterized protein n=1 Tax=Chlorella ohadii TaxID=2649997 RepID=A0AAD5DIL1_9CHLO|nr:hypothetical protein COHA_008537 [Chlorella ohadii]
MALTGREHMRSLVRVSRRWRRVCFDEPALWRSFTVRAYRVSETAAEQVLRLGRRAALLACAARHVRRFRWEEHTEELQSAAALCLYHCLGALRGSQLEQLQLSGPCTLLAGADAVAALQQLGSTVASLHLGACSAGPAGFAAAALGSHLRSLQLSTRELAAALLGSIAQMPQLAALRIEAYAWPDLSPLTRISQLRQLVLLDLRADGQDSMRPPALSTFPSCLERFSFESKHRSFQVAGCMLSRLRLWQGGTLDLGFEQGAAQHLPLPTLALGCCEPEAPLSELLGFLQPAGMPPRKFERLELSGKLPDPASLAGCTHLGQLSELPVACKLQMPVQPVEFGAEPIALVVAAQVRQAAHACLDTLDLSGNGIAILPAALSAATSLTHLTLDDNSLLWLIEAATPVLLALSRLQRLEIDNIGNADAPLLREWQLRMPRLRIVPMPV